MELIINPLSPSSYISLHYCSDLLTNLCPQSCLLQFILYSEVKTTFLKHNLITKLPFQMPFNGSLHCPQINF